MTRLHDLLLGPLLPPHHRSESEAQSIQEVVVHRPALQALRAQLRCSGRWRGGVLFGTSQRGMLSVDFIAPGTPPGYDPAQEDPLALEADYLLGWTDAVSTTHDGELDWQGMWIMTPNGELQDALDQMRWVQQARHRGLLTEAMILLFVGWEEGALRGTAYIQWDDPQSVRVRFQQEGSGNWLLPRTPLPSE